MSQKPDPKQYIQFDNPKSGCGMGCWAIGCTGIVFVFVMLCGGGFYGVFYSSLPLKIFEAAIEESGEVEIDGLTGNLTSGFSADEIRFKSTDEKWSTLTGIKFKYDSGSSIFGTSRIIIEEVSISEGTIYAEWDPDTNEFDFGFASELDEVGDEFDELGEEMRKEFGRSSSIREVRVDLVRIANLKIINPETELEITLDEIKFEGFHWLDDELVNLGELFVKSSQMDLETVPTIEFVDMENAKRFEGTLRSQIDHRLNTDVPFVIDFAADDNMKFVLKAFLFDNQLRYAKLSEATRLTYDEFSPIDFITPSDGRILPSELSMELEYAEETKDGLAKVNESGSFKIGETRFTDLRIDQPGEGKDTRVVGVGTVDGEEVEARIRIESPLSPLFKIGLESDAFDVPEELWSQTVFGDAYDELDDEHQKAVDASQPPPEPEVPITPETGDDENPESNEPPSENRESEEAPVTADDDSPDENDSPEGGDASSDADDSGSNLAA